MAKATRKKAEKKKSIDELLGETENEMICRISHLSVEEQYKERTIRAIVYLQGIAGIEETREQAEAGWRSMSSWDRKNTLDAYRCLAAD